LERGKLREVPGFQPITKRIDEPGKGVGLREKQGLVEKVEQETGRCSTRRMLNKGRNFTGTIRGQEVIGQKKNSEKKKKIKPNKKRVSAGSRHKDLKETQLV